MLYVGLFRNERIRDYEFWATLWQGPPPPKDFELIAAYNLMTDLRVIVFKAETTASIRFLDRFNFIGHFECHPALDQTEGYVHAFARDTKKFTAFLRARGASEDVIKREVGFRTAASKKLTLMDAIRFGRDYTEGRKKS